MKSLSDCNGQSMIVSLPQNIKYLSPILYGFVSTVGDSYNNMTIIIIVVDKLVILSKNQILM